MQACKKADGDSIIKCCEVMGVSRDAYYKHQSRVVQKQKREDTVVELAKEIRKEQPRMGCKKLYNRLKLKFEGVEKSIGRDKFIRVLGKRGMHIERKKKSTRTTYSNHEYAVAPNRVKNLEVTSKNQVFVSDITYLRFSRGFAYLFLVTDLHSRKIVGYYLSDNLSHHGAKEALEMALESIEDPSGIIHHSDRGCQYCCHEFIKLLRTHKMVPSMTDGNHCYQNAVAERVNGILKDEFYLDATFKSFVLAQIAVINAIRIYNTNRPHWSLLLKTPEQVYSMAA